MKPLLDAIYAALKHENWYAALSLALTIPDICGRLESPNLGSQTRFAEWFDKYVGPKYQASAGRQPFLVGNDCYALRCAYLHQGEFGIDDQRAKEALESFHFTIPKDGARFHCNKIDRHLQLQVDQFCIDICKGAEHWLEAMKDRVDVQERISKLGTIQEARASILSKFIK